MVAMGWSPEVLRLNSDRGETIPKSGDAFRVYLQLFFKDLDTTRGFEISAIHTIQGARWLTATVEEERTLVVADERRGGGHAASRPDCILELALNDGHNRRGVVEIFYSDGNVEAIRGPADGKGPPRLIVIEYIPPNIDLSYSDADRLSELRRQKRASGILDAIRHVEPRMKEAPEVLTSNGTTKIFCDIGTKELMPLGLMGQGTARVLRLVVRMERIAASAAEDGRAFLVDEIESGFHHEALVHVWRSLDEASRRNETQIFATTHSRECMESAYEGVDPDDLAIHRLEVDQDGTSRCITLSREAIEGTMQHGFEVR